MRYRVSILKNIVDKKYYHIESKKGFFSKWKHEFWTLQETLLQATSLKILLENGHSQHDIFRPYERIKMLRLTHLL